MESLDRNALVEDTIFIVTSDNGSPGRAGDPYTHGKDFHPFGTVTTKFGHEPNWPWRGMKRSIWEGGHRIPLIVRWPKRIKNSSICTQTVCLTDLMATFAKVVGYQLLDDAGEDSYDISPLWYGLTRNPIREATVLQSSSGGFGIRQGRWKLITGLGALGTESAWSPQLLERILNKLRQLTGEEQPNGQLYDMQLDPREQTNLWNDRQDVVRQLTELLERYKREGRSVPRN